ncbi:hypothetical protein X777_00226 [Ooceraea biroi]|uniref:THAP domain-containing protein n=1 Tax=Ooceraea biroi TaxID=2015173 RepID=A0A026VRW3_OOCBI|nr:hypothetical protein X777_00226 [Ooceraea biroi]
MVGATVLNITMDGCASNIATMQCLGANISPKNPQPYFTHPQTKEKVYTMLDAVHMIKLIRNSFASSTNIYDVSIILFMKVLKNRKKLKTMYLMNHLLLIAAYISGFVARKVMNKINCSVCKNLLIGTDTMSTLQKRKCRGERVVRENGNIIKKQHPIERLITTAMFHVTSHIFDNVLHMFEQAPLQDHRTILIKLILYTYDYDIYVVRNNKTYNAFEAN